MSFSHNPYAHIELVVDDSNEGWKWYCHGCGGEDKKPGTWDLMALQQDYFHHLMTSHKRTPDDFKTWSKY